MSFLFGCLPVATLISLFYACIIYKGCMCMYVPRITRGSRRNGREIVSLIVATPARFLLCPYYNSPVVLEQCCGSNSAVKWAVESI